MSKTLEEILSETGESDVKSALSTLLSALKEENQREWREWKELAQSVKDGMDEMKTTLKAIQEKPDPIFPEVNFPKKVLMDRPEWYREPEKASPIDHEAIADGLEKRMGKHFDALIERTANEHQSTREVLDDILNKEPEYGEADKKEPLRPAVNMGSVHKHSRWVRFSTAQGNIIGAIDGINKKFLLPSALIPNSETIRLNGGLPISSDDYTLTSNNLVFSASMTAPVQGSTMEIRGQT